MMPMDIGFLVVGNEILTGFTADTNSTFLARSLTQIGHRVARIITVEDNVEEIVRELRALLKDGHDVVFVCGGLGSTPDDVTMEAVGKALKLPLVLDPKAKTWIEDRVHQLHVNGRIPSDRMDEPHLRMALVPKDAFVLHNRAGTAPGTVVKLHSKGNNGKAQLVIVLPGVPAELKYLYSNEIEGKIILPSHDRPFFEELKVDIAESTMHEALKMFCTEFPEVYLGSYPQDDRTVILRLSGKERDVKRSLESLKAELSRLPKREPLKH